MIKRYYVEYFDKEQNEWIPDSDLFDTLEECIEGMQDVDNPDNLKLRIIEETISKVIITN